MLRFLMTLSKQRLLLPFYHIIADKTPTFAKHLYTAKSIANFERDITTFLQFYEPISLQELIRLSKEKNSNQQPKVHLTFDDGLSNFYEVVAPILKEKNIPATVFINTDFIDNKDLFYRYKASLLIEKYEEANQQEKEIFNSFVAAHSSKKEVKTFLLEIDFHSKTLLDDLAKEVGVDFNAFLKKEQPYLTTSQINALLADGFTIGTHSKNHPLYSTITEEEQLTQTAESMDLLVQKFNLSYKAFSFPFTDLGVKKSFFKKVSKDKLVAISFGISGIKKDAIPFHFQRIIFENTPSNTYVALLQMYVKYLLKIPLKKHKMPRE